MAYIGIRDMYSWLVLYSKSDLSCTLSLLDSYLYIKPSRLYIWKVTPPHNGCVVFPPLAISLQRRATQIQAPANYRELIPFPVLDLIFFFSSWPLVAWFEWKPCVSLSTKFLLKCCFRLWLISWWSVHIYSVPSWAYHKPQASFKFPLNVLVFNRQEEDIKYFSTLTSAFLASWDGKKNTFMSTIKTGYQLLSKRSFCFEQ